jgi:hypothetical protein
MRKTDFGKNVARPKIEARRSIRVAAAQISPDWSIRNH